MKNEIQNDPNINVFQNRIETLRSHTKELDEMSDLKKKDDPEPVRTKLLR